MQAGVLIAERKGDVAGGPQLAGPWRPQKELGFYASAMGSRWSVAGGDYTLWWALESPVTLG